MFNLADFRYCIGNPSAWDHYDDGMSERMRRAVAEIERLQEQLSHGMPAIEELTKEREMYRMRWLGSMTTRDAQLIRDENERLRALIKDACGVFEHYDLPEHAFHYRRAVEQSKDAVP